MPIDPVTGTLIATGVGMIGKHIDRKQQQKGIKQQNEFNRQLAQEQREWNTSMWHAQNRYNSPQQQMARFKAAGLNPHLIYGQGNAGNAGDVKGYDRAEAKNVNEGYDTFSSYNDFREQATRTNNIKAQTNVANQEAAKKAQETLNLVTDGKQKTRDLNLSTEMYDHQLDAAEANARDAINKANISTDDAYISSETKGVKVSMVKKQLEKITKETNGQQLLNDLRQLEKNLNQRGVQKSDNLIFRILMQMPQGEKVFKLLEDHLK